MEQKSFLISALSVGVGVGVGIGLASGQSVSKWGGFTYSSSSSNSLITADQIQHEMLRLIVDGRDSNVTFDKFPYYLRHML
jgi:hypothetical protein